MKKTFIFGHKNPDGDCYGAQVGLKELLKSLYPHKNIYIIGNDDTGYNGKVLGGDGKLHTLGAETYVGKSQQMIMIEGNTVSDRVKNIKFDNFESYIKVQNKFINFKRKDERTIF